MAYDHIDQQVLDHVAAHGWSCMSVGEGDGDPNFTYSIGFLKTLGAPEFIVFGLPIGLQHSMLSELYRQIADGRFRAEPGAVADGLIDGYPCIVRPVWPGREAGYFNFALWHHAEITGSKDPFRAYQIFWPGKENRLYPWDTGCGDTVSGLQPRLDQPPAAQNN